MRLFFITQALASIEPSGESLEIFLTWEPIVNAQKELIKNQEKFLVEYSLTDLRRLATAFITLSEALQTVNEMIRENNAQVAAVQAEIEKEKASGVAGLEQLKRDLAGLASRMEPAKRAVATPGLVSGVGTLGIVSSASAVADDATSLVDATTAASLPPRELDDPSRARVDATDADGDLNALANLEMTELGARSASPAIAAEEGVESVGGGQHDQEDGDTAAGESAAAESIANAGAAEARAVDTSITPRQGPKKANAKPERTQEWKEHMKAEGKAKADARKAAREEAARL